MCVYVLQVIQTKILYCFGYIVLYQCLLFLFTFNKRNYVHIRVDIIISIIIREKIKQIFLEIIINSIIYYIFN